MIGILLILASLIFLEVLSNAFTVISLALIISIIGYKWKDLFKIASVFYVLAFIITVLGMIFYDQYYITILHGGLLGYAFICVVMFVGIFPNKSIISRTIKRNRGMFSILGFIFISSHAYLHLFTPWGGINLFGLAAYIIMAPLAFISFRVIRKQMKPKDWFTIQKAAYAIYGLLFIHLLMVSQPENQIVYAVLATIYINNKLLKEFRK